MMHHFKKNNSKKHKKKTITAPVIFKWILILFILPEDIVCYRTWREENLKGRSPSSFSKDMNGMQLTIYTECDIIWKYLKIVPA